MSDFDNNYPTHLKLNDRIILPDGRLGTICYNFLDGCGGVFGEHEFKMPDSGFSDELPEPQFMLRAPQLEARWRSDGHHPNDIECVGHQYRYAEEEA